MSFATGPLEQSVTQLSFALMLRDGLSFANALAGDVTVTAGAQSGLRKDSSGVFVFFGLGAGPCKFAVSSAADTPYYLPANITVTLPPPSPEWPAFPDIGLANPALMLWDPGQPAAFRAQFVQSCLSPAIAYPFDPGATLVRGTAQSSSTGQPLAGVTVSVLSGGALPYVTGADGQFVLALQQPAALPTSVTISAQLPGGPAVNNSVTVSRADTATLTIKLGE